MLDFEHMTVTNKTMTFMVKMLSNRRLCVLCIMDSSSFSQKMPYYLLTLLVYMALQFTILFSYRISLMMPKIAQKSK